MAKFLGLSDFLYFLQVFYLIQCPDETAWLLSHDGEMRLFLVRHGETVDNVAGVCAGTTDSALTSHGVLQANRLGRHMACTNVKLSHIFSSDLMRAFRTAEAIRLAQEKPTDPNALHAHETKQLAVLREKDFGSLEGKSYYYERSRDSKKDDKDLSPHGHGNALDFKHSESQESMMARSNTFIDEYLLELFYTVPDDYAVVVVSHGIFLAHLWRCMYRRFAPTMISLAPNVVIPSPGLSLEYLNRWSNTGYLELEIKLKVGDGSTSTSLAATKAPELILISEIQATNETNGRRLLDMLLVVKAVNSLEHLVGLKKTRGGIGSSKHDDNQKTMESFFKTRTMNEGPSASHTST